MKTTTLTVTITAEDIREGSTNMCSCCPIARALRRAVGLPNGDSFSRWDAAAQPSRLFARGEKWQIACDTPDEVNAAIREWDERGTMRPFSFKVEARSVMSVAAPNKAWLVAGWRHRAIP